MPLWVFYAGNLLRQTDVAGRRRSGGGNSDSCCGADYNCLDRDFLQRVAFIWPSRKSAFVRQGGAPLPRLAACRYPQMPVMRYRLRLRAPAPAMQYGAMRGLDPLADAFFLPKCRSPDKLQTNSSNTMVRPLLGCRLGPAVNPPPFGGAASLARSFLGCAGITKTRRAAGWPSGVRGSALPGCCVWSPIRTPLYGLGPGSRA